MCRYMGELEGSVLGWDTRHVIGGKVLIYSMGPWVMGWREGQTEGGREKVEGLTEFEVHMSFLGVSAYYTQ